MGIGSLASKACSSAEAGKARPAGLGEGGRRMGRGCKGRWRGSGLILDVSLSVGIWSALFISPSSISFAP